MQAVILAAGRGTRMEELTTAVPKAMVELKGKPLLDYKFEAMPPDVTEIIVVIGYFGDVIKGRYSGEYNGKKITYVNQDVLDGTAGALWYAKPLLTDRFLVMMGDDVYTRADIHACAQDRDGWAVLVQEVHGMHRAGSVELDDQAGVAGIVEGDKGTRDGLACTNLFCLDTRIFSQPMVPKQEGSDEYGLPQTVIAAGKALGIRIEPIFTVDWIQINAPADLAKASQMLGEIGA